MMLMLVMSTLLFYDQGVNITPYAIESIPQDCKVRIDIMKTRNKKYNGYAWFSGRIQIWDGNGLTNKEKGELIRHEIWHVCAKDNRKGSYEERERKASQ